MTQPHILQRYELLGEGGEVNGGAKMTSPSDVMCLLKCVFFSRLPLHSCFSPSLPKNPPCLSLFLLPWLILAAMAPLVNGAAIYRWRCAWLGRSGPFGRSQRPRRIGWGAHRRLGPSRVGGKHGGFTSLWGALGTRSPPAPAQSEEIPGQRGQ